jgi:hypothetical protein
MFMKGHQGKGSIRNRNSETCIRRSIRVSLTSFQATVPAAFDRRGTRGQVVDSKLVG